MYYFSVPPIKTITENTGVKLGLVISFVFFVSASTWKISKYSSNLERQIENNHLEQISRISSIERSILVSNSEKWTRAMMDDYIDEVKELNFSRESGHFIVWPDPWDEKFDRR